MESGLKVLVLPLCLPVRLWMKARRQAGGGPQQFTERDKVGHLAEPVHNGEDDCVSAGAGQPRHEIHRDVGPWTTRDWQRLKESRRSACGSCR